jgi:ribose/xylose/arabinose/galactoside ABC-type transport system permease subunit
MGTGFEFAAIAAVVIGGTSLNGGEGTIGGTLIGVLIMGVINNALNLLGVSVYTQDVVRGGIIFLAVMIDALRNRYAQALD